MGLSGARLTCSHCRKRGEEDWCVRDPRPRAHQAQDKASNESWCEGDVWCGAEGEGKASQDSCESLRSCSTEKSDLDERIVILSGVFQVSNVLWESHGVGLEAPKSCCGHGARTRNCTMSVPWT